LNLTGTDGTAELFRLVAAHNAAVILCYVQGKNVREVSDFDFSADPFEMMRGILRGRLKSRSAMAWRKSFSIPASSFYYRQLAGTASSACGIR